MRGGIVTQLCQNYGLIDNSVYFTAGEVLGGVPLRVGDPVSALAVQDGAHGGWRALRVGFMRFTPFSLICFFFSLLLYMEHVAHLVILC